MPDVYLGDLIRPAGSKAGSRSDLPVYSVTKHRGFVPSREYFKKQVYSKDLSSYLVVEPGDFAYASIHLDEGSIGVAPNRGLISPMYTVFSIDPDRVVPEYLIRFMRSDRALAEYPRFGQGSAERRRSIALSRLGTLLVPLPPMEEQRRIADILDRADALRAKRREALALLGDLTQSIFLDMFGDPQTNPHGWIRRPLVTVVRDIESGASPICEARPATEEEWGVIKLSAVTRGSFEAAENKAYLGDVDSMARNEIRSGDLLMTRKNTRDLVGAVALVGYVRPRLLMPDLVFRLDVNEEVVRKSYLQSLLMNPQKRSQIADLSNGSASSMPNISKARLRGLPVELPPLERQLQFEQRLISVKDLRRRVSDSAAVGRELFEALQQRAFAGEL